LDASRIKEKSVMILLFRDYQFEFHKFQDHWRFIWSLTSEPIV